MSYVINIPVRLIALFLGCFVGASCQTDSVSSMSIDRVVDSIENGGIRSGTPLMNIVQDHGKPNFFSMNYEVNGNKFSGFVNAYLDQKQVIIFYGKDGKVFACCWLNGDHKKGDQGEYWLFMEEKEMAEYRKAVASSPL